MTSVAVPFSRTDRWDAAYHLHRPQGWRATITTRFGDIASRRVEPVAEGERESALRGSIHFDGSISLRSGRAGLGRIFYAFPNDLVFSKIDARNGAIALVPADMPNLAFSSEFPVYEIDEMRVLPAFMKVLCRLPTFRAQINALVVGHSGRKRLAPAVLENLEIPVPPLAEQAEVINEHAALVGEAAAAATRSAAMAEQAYREVMDALGIPWADEQVAAPSVAVPFARVESWSVRKAREIAAGASSEVQGSHVLQRLGEDGLAKIAYGLTKSPQNRPADNPRPYLRVANVQAGELDLGEIKYLDVPDALMPRYRLEPGDLLLCEGNSEALVGRPALWRGEIDECVHQNHIIRVRLDRERLLPEFVVHYMNTPAARRYFLSRAKRTTNLASINSSDVAEFPCPVPSVDVQRTILLRCDAALTEARCLRETSTKKIAESYAAAEARVVGSASRDGAERASD